MTSISATRCVCVCAEIFFKRVRKTDEASSLFLVCQAVAALKRLSLRKKVAIERACDEYGVFVRGPGNPSEGALPPDPRWVGLGSRGVLRRDEEEATTASASAVKAHDEHRIRAGIAEGAGELGDAYPLECNFDALHGVSFSKGCYMGQENTARQHFRGVVRKRVVPFVIPFETADVVFERGKKIVNDRGDAVGEIITARDGEIGLMRARMNFVRENLAGRATFRVAEAPASSPELVATAPEWWPESYILGSDGHE